MFIKRRAPAQRPARKEFLRAFEIAPVNLELLEAEERAAAITATRELYDAIPGPFQVLSVPIERSPSEHLDALSPATGVPRPYLTAYAGLYRDLAANLARPPRRCLMVLQANSEATIARVAELVRRTGEEHGIRLQPVADTELGQTASQLAGQGSTYRVGPNIAEGPEALTLVAMGRRWPAQIEPGWAAPVLALAGVDAISMRVRPLSRAEAMSFLTVRLRQVRAAERLASERGELSDVERERVLQTSSSGRRTVHAGAGRLYLVDVVLLVRAPDRATLAERLDVLRLETKSLGFEPEAATFRLADAWRGVVPGGSPAPIAERNLDSASLAASLLNVAGDLYEPKGHLYGRARTTGAPIVLDRFARPSHNAIVLGQTGTGKTMATGAEMVRAMLQGIRVLAVDPLGDYRRLTAELGGLYIEPGSGKSGLNPFALTGERNAGALGAKLQILPALVGAMVGNLSRDERAVLDPALQKVYERAGITADPATHVAAPPTLANLHEILRETPGAAPIANRLERWAIGSLAPVFAGNAPSLNDRALVVVGLAALADPETRSVAQLAALALLWDAVRIDKARKLIVVDEAWKVMRHPAGAAFIEELARSARHYHAGLQLATQDIVEFLRSDFGESIVKQCDIRILLGQTPEGADALARYFDLTPAERRSLIHARPGEGLLFVGRSHVAYEATVSRREYAALTSRPSDLLEQARTRYAPADST
jgi:TraG P-loop domain